MKVYFRNSLSYILFLLIVLSSFHVKAQNDILNIGVKYEFPPYSYINSENEYEGFSIDLFKEIIPSDYKVVFKSYKTLNDSIDFSVIGVLCDARVPEGYTFIEIPHVIDYYIFMRKNSNIGSLANLYNKRIIVVKNDLPFNSLYKNRTAHILRVISFQEPITLLNKGINDCSILPFHTGMSIIKQKDIDNLNYISIPYLTYQAGIAVNNNNPELIKQIKTAVDKIVSNNKYHNIENKWLYSQYECNSENSKISVLLIILILSIVFIIAFLIIMLILQKREIHISVHEQISSTNRKNIAPLLFPINEEAIQDILNNMPVWMIINDEKGNISHMSKAFLNEGMNALNLPIKYSLTDCFDDKSAHKLFSYDNEIYNLRKKYVSEKISFRINNIEYSKYIIKYPIQYIEKGEVYILNILIDNVLQGEIAFSSALINPVIKKIIDSINDIIIFKNIKSKIIGGNKALYEWLGKPERDVIGNTLSNILGNEKGKLFDSSDSMIAKTGISYEDNIEDTISDEDILYKSFKYPIKDNNNEVIGIISINKDITLIEDSKKEIGKAKEIIAESNRIKSSFLANMSHEIRTPMNSIIGFSDLLSDPDLTLDQRIEIIDIIQQNGFELVDLIDDIIDISKIESGQIHLKYINFNLNQVLLDAYEFAIQKKRQLHKDDIEISYKIGSIKDEFTINSEPFRLKQIFKNILNTNINNYSDSSIDIGYVLLEKEILFYINTNHSKVSENFIEELLTKESTNFAFSDIEEASGVSIIIAKSLIEMIGGKIWIHNSEQELAEFYFTLPLDKVDANKNLRTNNVTKTPDWSDLTILIAEDEDINFLLLSNILEKTNAEIIRVINGEEAVTQYSENMNDIDLVLMDIRMPILNGVEATKQILEINPEALIIAQTAYSMIEDKYVYERNGMKGIVAKPIDPVTLFSLCNTILNR